MSSSSSDSDSDDLEPIRRIRINIKPKESVAKREGANIDAIKASVEAWRPLGPRPHHTLTRRQSSLSSVSSLSFGTGSVHGGSGSTTATSSTGANNNNNNNNINNYGGGTTGFGSTSIASATITTAASATTTKSNNNHASNHNFMRSSPSCSSLVNEFNNRSSFSNFMSNISRTSSPLTFMNNYGDTVPIALAIQESIELTVKGQHGPTLSETKFETRALGNIKVAFPNSFARSCSNGYRPASLLKLRLHSTENILRYYASGLIKDLDSESSSLTETSSVSTSTNKDSIDNDGTSMEGDEHTSRAERYSDLFDMQESPNKQSKGATKIIEFDMDALMNQLKQLYDQMPDARYYNVDVLRYQIAPIDQFEKCPIQVCAYWRLEPRLIKLRIDFKHSQQSNLNLERLRELVFEADLSNLIPAELNVQTMAPSVMTTKLSNSNDNNNLTTFRNLSSSGYDSDGSTTLTTSNIKSNSNADLFEYPQAPLMHQDSNHQYRKLININDNNDTKLPPPPSASSSSSSSSSSSTTTTSQIAYFKHPSGSSSKQRNSSTLTSALQIRLPPPPSKGQSRGTLSRVSPKPKPNANQSIASERQQNMPSSQLPSSNSYDLLSLSLSQPQQQQQQQQQLQQISHDNSFDNQMITSALNNAHITRLSASTTTTTKNVKQPEGFTPIAAPRESLLVGRGASQTALPAAAAAAPPPTTPTPPNSTPYITYDPQAHWDRHTKQLTWKFDNLLSYYKTDGYGSLLAKLDFRNCSGMQEHLIGQQQQQQQEMAPKPINVKFMVVDSTISKIGLSIDSAGYRMSLLKKEVRSGRYKSEPYIF